MKRYEFRLATVLRVRRAEKEAAQAVLMRANHELRARIAERDREAARYAAICASASTGARTLEEFRREELAVELGARVLDDAQRAVAAAAASAALAQVAWSGASGRVEILERLDARRRAEWAEEERRAEVALIDDLVTARYARAGAGDAR